MDGSFSHVTVDSAVAIALRCHHGVSDVRPPAFRPGDLVRGRLELCKRKGAQVTDANASLQRRYRELCVQSTETNGEPRRDANVD